jgi:hypothetical protein
MGDFLVVVWRGRRPSVRSARRIFLRARGWVKAAGFACWLRFAPAAGNNVNHHPACQVAAGCGARWLRFLA